MGVGVKTSAGGQGEGGGGGGGKGRGGGVKTSAGSDIFRPQKNGLCGKRLAWGDRLA